MVQPEGSAGFATSPGKPRRRPLDVRAGRARSVVRVLAALEVALELPGDRLAAGLGKVRGVPGLLQGADVVADLVVVGGQLVDPALPGPGVLGQLTDGDA